MKTMSNEEMEKIFPFHVIDVESMEQAEYRGMVGTKDYGIMLVNVATEYNDAFNYWECKCRLAAIQLAVDRM